MGFNWKKLDYFKKPITLTVANSYGFKNEKKIRNNTSYGSWPGLFFTVVGTVIFLVYLCCVIVGMFEDRYDQFN